MFDYDEFDVEMTRGLPADRRPWVHMGIGVRRWASERANRLESIPKRALQTYVCNIDNVMGDEIVITESGQPPVTDNAAKEKWYAYLQSMRATLGLPTKKPNAHTFASMRFWIDRAGAVQGNPAAHSGMDGSIDVLITATGIYVDAGGTPLPKMGRYAFAQAQDIKPFDVDAVAQFLEDLFSFVEEHWPCIVATANRTK